MELRSRGMQHRKRIMKKWRAQDTAGYRLSLYTVLYMLNHVCYVTQKNFTGATGILCNYFNHKSTNS
jgi:hypothetical protein